MLQNLTDTQLINELSNRIEDIRAKNASQEDLMNELKQVNERLLRSENIKSNFLSNIRNEINNPLTSALELSASLANIEMDVAQKNHISRLIYNEIFSLDFQLKNIFLSAELESGQILITPSLVDIENIFSSHLKNYEETLSKKGITLTSTLKLDQPFLTDSEYFDAVIRNLVSNAVRFCNENGRIDISTCIRSGKFIFNIKNTCTLPDDLNITQMFDRFTQAENGITKSHPGHGLGLSIVKSITEYLNGTIDVQLLDQQEISVELTLNEMEFDGTIDYVSDEANEFLFINDNTASF
jgi:signal transduction histidine kinase